MRWIVCLVLIAGCDKLESRSASTDDSAAQLKAARAANSELTEKLRAATAEVAALTQQNKTLAQQLETARVDTAGRSSIAAGGGPLVNAPSVGTPGGDAPPVVSPFASNVDEKTLTTAERITLAWTNLSKGPFEASPTASPRISDVADDVARYKGRCVVFNDVSVDARVELADGVYVVWLKDDRGDLFGGADTIRLSLGKRMADDIRREFLAGTRFNAKLYCLIGAVPQYIGDPSPAAWIYRVDTVDRINAQPIRFTPEGISKPAAAP